MDGCNLHCWRYRAGYDGTKMKRYETKTPVAYLAHPLRAFVTETSPALEAEFTVSCNLRNAKRWLKVLTLANPGIAIIAPWIGKYEAWPEADAVDETREMEIRRNCVVIARCDAIILAGGQISDGMEIERKAAVSRNRLVVDLTHLGYWAPSPRKLAATADLGAALRAA